MKIETLEVAGIQPSFKGMRNPLNSWHKSDSGYKLPFTEGKTPFALFVIGDEDMGLAERLIKGGSEHCKYRRMIQVWADFDMPRYWWSEFDTYKIGTVADSCSTMHKLLNNQNPITLDMFVTCEDDEDIAKIVVERLEELRVSYLTSRDDKLLVRAKRLLMEGFLQLRTVNLNYETISNIYHQRKHHRLKEEWIGVFCTWVETLPYAQELIINKY